MFDFSSFREVASIMDQQWSQLLDSYRTAKSANQSNTDFCRARNALAHFIYEADEISTDQLYGVLESGDVGLVRLIEKCGKSPAIIQRNIDWDMFCAVAHCDDILEKLDILEYLLQNGGDPNIESETGHALIDCFILTKQPHEVVEKLLLAGAIPDKRSNHEGRDPEFAPGCVDSCMVLVAYGGDRSRGLLELLLRYGAILNTECALQVAMWMCLHFNGSRVGQEKFRSVIDLLLQQTDENGDVLLTVNTVSKICLLAT